MSLELVRTPEGPEPDLDRYLRDAIRQIVREELREREHGPRWLTVKQAGEILGITPAAVAARVRRGKLPGRLYQRRYYIDRSALDAAIDESRATVPQLGANPSRQSGGRARREPPRP